MRGVETGLFLDKVPYIKSGSGPRRAVVFLGGNALFKPLGPKGARRYADTFAKLLPADYTAYILGYEAPPPDGYGLDSIVGDFARIVREEIGRATVIGLSFGGFVSLRFAAEHPELVDRLVMRMSACRFSAEGRGKIAHQFSYLREGNLRALLRENAVLFRRPWFNWPLAAQALDGPGHAGPGVQPSS